MSFRIRHASLKDLSSIQKLNLALFEKEKREYDPLLNTTWTFGKEGTEYFTGRITKDDGCVLIAVYESKVIGYLCGGIAKQETYRNLPVTAELENTLVLQKFRSQGVGKKLYSRFVRWCKRKHVGKIVVKASAQNSRATKFYTSQDFKPYSLVLEADI